VLNPAIWKLSTSASPGISFFLCALKPWTCRFDVRLIVANFMVDNTAVGRYQITAALAVDSFYVPQADR
jgi:hypothetical protein